MNKKDEHELKGKALDIALSLIDTNKPTLDKCVETGVQMAAWKEEQVIEKALSYLNNKFYFNNLFYGVVSTDFNSMEEMIEDFKKAMKEE